MTQEPKNKRKMFISRKSLGKIINLIKKQDNFSTKFGE
jgi:hypothetical protein